MVNTLKSLVTYNRLIPVEEQLPFSKQQLIAFLTEIGYYPSDTETSDSFDRLWFGVMWWLDWNTDRVHGLPYEKINATHRVEQLKAKISEMQNEIIELEVWIRTVQ